MAMEDARAVSTIAPTNTHVRIVPEIKGILSIQRLTIG